MLASGKIWSSPARATYRHPLHTHRWQRLALCLATATLVLSGCQPTVVRPAHPSAIYRNYASHMSEASRTGISRVAIAPGDAEILFSVSGSDYGKHGDEISKGAADGVAAALSSMTGDPMAILLLPFVITIGAGVGGISGAVEADRREQNKDAADGLIEVSKGQVANELLAQEILRQMSDGAIIQASIVSPVNTGSPVSDIKADALLTVTVTNVNAEIFKNALLGVSVQAELLRLPGGELLYSEQYTSSDMRPMSDWAENDGKAWREHLRLAKIRISERIIQSLFTLLEFRHVLRPRATESYKNFADGTLRTLTPTLAWQYVLLGDDTHLDSQTSIDPNAITWDLQIQHNGEKVYQRLGLPAQQHQVEEPLVACQHLTWSVRPRFQTDSGERMGEWMTVARSERGSIVAPRQDFHPLRAPCPTHTETQP